MRYCLSEWVVLFDKGCAILTTHEHFSLTMPSKVIVMQVSAPVLCRHIWKSSQWLFSKHLMLWDRITDVKETYYIITSIFIWDQVIFPQQRMRRVLDSRYICSPTTFQTWQEKHHPESSLKHIKRDRESRLPCPSILKVLWGFLCYTFSDFFNSHLTVLSVLRHLCRCVARESYAEPYPGCMGISEEVKLQSISLELIRMTYSGAGLGREGEKKPYFLINLSVSQIQRIYANIFFLFFF